MLNNPTAFIKDTVYFPRNGMNLFITVDHLFPDMIEMKTMKQEVDAWKEHRNNKNAVANR